MLKNIARVWPIILFNKRETVNNNTLKKIIFRSGLKIIVNFVLSHDTGKR